MNEMIGSVGNVDTAFRALAVQSRRCILIALLEATDGTIRFEPLARRVAEPDHGEALGIVVLEVLQRDLSHLEATGLIEYDISSETITTTDSAETVEPLLAAAQ